MKFIEVAIDTELIGSMFAGTPVISNLNEIREDFEIFNIKLFPDELDLEANNLESLVFYKTELFRSYCLGILSSVSKESNFNKKITNDIARENDAST